MILWIQSFFNGGVWAVTSLVFALGVGPPPGFDLVSVLYHSDPAMSDFLLLYWLLHLAGDELGTEDFLLILGGPEMTAELLSPDQDDKGVKMAKRRTKADPEAVIAMIHSAYGKPENYYKTDAHHIYADTWRVNVWASIDTDCVVERKRIDRSYFVKIITGEGGILTLETR